MPEWLCDWDKAESPDGMPNCRVKRGLPVEDTGCTGPSRGLQPRCARARAHTHLASSHPWRQWPVNIRTLSETKAWWHPPAVYQVTTTVHFGLSHLDEHRPRKPSGYIWGQLSHWVTVHWLPFPLASSLRRGTELFISMSLPHAELSKCLQQMGAQRNHREWQYLELVLGRPVLCHAILIPGTVYPPLSTNRSAYSPSHLLTNHCEIFLMTHN